MRNEDLLLLLAQKLKDMPSEGYSMCDLTKDALAVAGQMPEFQARGFALVCNDDGPKTEAHPRGSSRVTWNGLYDIDAAARFFDITRHEAMHLFDQFEADEYGNSEKSRFDPKNGPSRREEPPAWTGGRIKSFLSNREERLNNLAKREAS